MTNPNERSFDQQHKTTEPADPSKKNPSQQSGQRSNEQDLSKRTPLHDGGQSQPKQQDPSKKDPSQADDSGQRDRERAEQAEKRRAS
jgi:hypothetical protein